MIDLVGYTDKLSVAPGESVSFMVSSTAPRYLARLVRLVHGDDDPRGPGVKEERLAWSLEGERDGRVQELRNGSYGIGPPLTIGPSLAVNVWVCPTTPGSREQAIVAQGDWALVLGEDGAPALRVGETFVASGQPLPTNRHRRFFNGSSRRIRRSRSACPTCSWPAMASYGCRRRSGRT